MVVFAGIRVDLDALLEHDHTTFLRRSRELDFRRLTPSETRHVLAETIRIGGKDVTVSIRTSEGHRYCAWGPVAG